MMRQYELVERVQSYEPQADEALLNRAYVYAMKAHGHQKRASGDPYFSHPLEVAAILTDLRLDSATIVTALLHDVIEDTDVTRSEIDQLFGAEIGALVEGLTKIKRLDLVSKKAQQAESFRKLLVAISSDIRVLLVKLADRLHNMRTMEHMRDSSRRRSSEETLEIYAPLAGRMGMQALRDELEDHAFRWMYPEAYMTLSDKLAALRERNEGLVEQIRISLEAKIAESGIKAEVEGREKKPYSIWRKMENRQIALEQLSDIYGFRVLVGSIDDCYRVLGLAHTTWPTVPGRFKDYISTPKQNNYQSIHTTVVGARHQRVEMQIRTRDMHDVAEYGVAAHALYKDATGKNGADGGGSIALAPASGSGPYMWLRRLVETLLDGSNSEEFLEHTKLELFHDQVYCFTPKGRIIALPRGATPLDFAYAVHTDVGNAAVSAFVNGRHQPIDIRLRNGDQIEIQTSKTHTPPLAWEAFAVTGRARSAIRRAARDAVRRQYSELGRSMLANAFEQSGVTYDEKKLREALPRLASGQKTIDDVLAGIARQEFSIRDVLKACLPDANMPEPRVNYRPKNRLDRGDGEEGWFVLSKQLGLKFRLPGTPWENVSETDSADAPLEQGVGQQWVDEAAVSFDDGGAVPGDRVVGVLTPTGSIQIFQIYSPKLKEFEQNQWIDVTWDINAENPLRFPAQIRVTVVNEPGTLAQIAQLIGEADGNIDHLRMVNRGIDFTEMHIEVEVWDLAHLEDIIAGLQSKKVVNSVERVFEK